MERIAPNIKRQRFLIEGYYDSEVDEGVIEDYFTEITRSLKLKRYGQSIIFAPGGEGAEKNQGYDAFVPLIDSGISLYVWTADSFLSVIIFTCKDFDEKKALEVTKKFFKIKEHISKDF